jgi:hypothetical protein
MDIRVFAIAALSAVCMSTGAAINAVYQYDRGGPFALPLAVLAVTSIAMAGITPITFMRSMRGLNAFGMIVSAFVFMVAIGFNFSNATGIAAFERDKTVSTRTAASDSAERLQWQLGTFTKSRTDLAKDAAGKATAVIQAELSGLQQDAAWTATKQCTDATLPASRTFCAGYKSREAQLAAALKVEELDGKIEAINHQLDLMHGVPGQAADPQASAVNFALSFIGIKAKEGDVGTGLSLWLAMLVEVIASLGPVVLQLLFEPSRRPVLATARAAPSAPISASAPKGKPGGAPSRGKGQKGRAPRVKNDAPKPAPSPRPSNVVDLRPKDATKKDIPRSVAEQALKEAGTQRDAAAKLGISPRTLRRILTAEAVSA